MKDIPVQRKRSGFTLQKLLKLYGVRRSTWHRWQCIDGFLPSSGDVSRYNDRALTQEEVERIVEFRRIHSEVGYRKLCWMMNDAKVVYASESSVYSALKKHNMLWGFKSADSKGTEKEYRNKPTHVHHHWHTDIAYVKIRGTFYFLIMLIDGYSRFLLHWELMTDMTGRSVELFVQEAREKYLHAQPTLINDNGSAFISLDFKKLLSRLDIQQVFTRRNHPQTNGKAERMVGLVRQEALRPSSPDSYKEAYGVLENYCYIYNYQRLHAGIKFLRPADVFFGRADEVLSKRKQNLMLARLIRAEANRKNRDLSIVGRGAVPFIGAQAQRPAVDKSSFIN